MTEKYDLKDMNTPVLQGTALSLACKAIEPLPTIGSLLVANSGGFILRKKKFKDLLANSPPLSDPTKHAGYQARAPSTRHAGYDDLSTLMSSDQEHQRNAPFYSCRDYYEAYTSKEVDPVSVAEAIIAAVREDEARNAAIGGERICAMALWNEADLLEQARESKRRLESGAARSVLEGVPFVVKNMIDVKGVPTRCGTTYMEKENGIADNDAWCVRKLREAGMILIGTSVLHEIGIAPIGVSVPPKTSSRNPYNTRFHTGGSSSGSAAAVVYGLCPIGLGTDTGGSIRIPAACSGCFGLKATYNEVKMDGVYPFNPATDHAGPLASTTEDLALALQAITGADLSGFSAGKGAKEILKGKKIGVYKAWFYSAKNAKEREYTDICSQAVKRLEKMGAEVVDISIPYLEAMKVALLISVSHQAGEALSELWKKYKGEMLGSTRFTMIAAKAWNDKDFIASQKMRAYAIDRVLEVFESCDVIATPSCQVPAPKIKALNLNDRSDITLVGKLMKYIFLGNLAGLPGVACPVGYTEGNDLPVSLHFYANFFDEDLLLQFASAVEHGVLSNSRKVPEHFVDILGSAKAN